ncbi:MAG: hypothetical protein ACI845_000303 [Gammaproteobacteria bacterium]
MYYLYTDKFDNQTKFPACILETNENGVRIRIGRLDIETKEVSTMESTVSPDLLQSRSIPCSYEDELAAP